MDSIAKSSEITEENGKRRSYAAQYAKFHHDNVASKSTSLPPTISVTTTGGFKPDSVFYEPSSSMAESMDSESEAGLPAGLSRNSIFFQDFSAYPTAKPSPISNSRNGIFGQDFSTLAPVTPCSLQVSSMPSPSSTIGDTPCFDHHAERLNSIPETTAANVALSKLYPGFSSSAMEASSPTSPSLSARHYESARLLDMANIRHENSYKFQVHYVPIYKNKLGEGRHACVYKGTFTDSSFDVLSPPVVSKLYRSDSGNFSYVVADEQVPVDSPPAYRGSLSKSGFCAVKCLHPGEIDAQADGLAEALVLKTIQSWGSTGGHPNINRLLAVKEEKFTDKKTKQDASSIVLVVQYCSAGSLARYVLENQNLCGRRRWINWCKQLASAVAFIHTGHVENNKRMALVHMDIKPHNVMLNDHLECKLADFGSAVLLELDADDDRPPFLKDGLGRGTQAYSPPEILTAPDFSYSFYTDIYALGCTFYFLLTGREPFAEVRNPAHQLHCIRKGFFQSGSNPLTPFSPASPAPQSPRLAASSQSLPVFPSHKSPSMAYSTIDMPPLLCFLNGETLHANVSSDKETFEKIVGLISKCTALNPMERPTAAQVVAELDVIDNMLVLGTGFDVPDQVPPSPTQVDGVMTSPMADDAKVRRIPGGRSFH